MVKGSDKQRNRKTGFLQEHPLFCFLILMGIWTGLVFLYPFVLADLQKENDLFPGLERMGQLGDSLGVLNAFATGGALAAAFIAFMLQRKDLQISQTELQETQKIMATQNITLSRQAMETTLFNLIELHTRVVDRLEFRLVFSYVNDGALGVHSRKPPATGQGVFEALVANANDMNGPSIQDDFKEIVNATHDLLDPWRRNIEAILGFLHRNQRKNTDEYIDIFNSCLSENESHFIYLSLVYSDTVPENLLYYVHKLCMVSFAPNVLHERLYELIDSRSYPDN